MCNVFVHIACNRRIKEVHEAYGQDKCITCSTNEELTNFLI